MRTLALAGLLLSASVAHAADDAPLSGGIVPPGSQCYDAKERANIARALVTKDARIASLEKDAGVPVAIVVLSIALGVVVGGAAGYGLAKAVK